MNGPGWCHMGGNSYGSRSNSVGPVEPGKTGPMDRSVPSMGSLPGELRNNSTDRAALPKTVYCFDFDGVLCDSIDESLLTSYNAYYGRNVKGVLEIDPALRKFFYEHRYMVRPAAEYYILYHVFEKGERTLGNERFLELQAPLAKEMKDHAARFYACREHFRRDLEYWLSLHRLYPECIDFLEKRSHSFFVVTNKDRESILTLSRHHGYADRIIAIYSHEIAIKKKILMEKLIGDHGLSPLTHRIIFVDDHEGTLGELKELELDLYLAGWGYTKGVDSSAFRSLHSLGELP